MSSHDKSHRAPPRKWSGRRIAVLAVATIGVVAASWLAPGMNQPAPSAPNPTPASLPQPILPAVPPELAAVEVAVDFVGPPSRARRAVRRRGVALDAGAATEPAGYEILSAAELDRISQARE